MLPGNYDAIFFHIKTKKFKLYSTRAVKFNIVHADSY